jgi:hypothetical protein
MLITFLFGLRVVMLFVLQLAHRAPEKLAT